MIHWSSTDITRVVSGMDGEETDCVPINDLSGRDDICGPELSPEVVYGMRRGFEKAVAVS